MNIRDVCPTTHMPASSDFTAWPKSHNLESFSSKTSRTPAAAPCTGVQRNQHAHSAPATALAYTRTTLTALPGFAISGYRPSKFRSRYHNVTGVLLLNLISDPFGTVSRTYIYSTPAIHLHCCSTRPCPTRHRPPAEPGNTAACVHRDQQNRPTNTATALHLSVSNATPTSS